MLGFDYESDGNSYDIATFFDKEGKEKFNPKSKEQMLIMLQDIATKLNIDDEYGIKRLEVMIHYELPFFAINRRLIRDWLLKNFIY